MTFPADDELTILFAHGAYQMADRFAMRETGIKHSQVRSFSDFAARVADADVVCTSMMWKNELLSRAPKLKFIQSISAGIDQYDVAAFKARDVRLASAAGVNANAVAEHALALTLALNRQIHTGRDNQAKAHWRPMHPTIAQREAEIGGKTMIIVGMGRIGARIAHFARAFDMHVIGVRRDVAAGLGGANEVVGTADLARVLPRADVLVLACPLTKETEHLIGPREFALLKPSAQLINVARGKVVDEAALIAALQGGKIAGAGIDVTREEPLSAQSPLWSFQQVLVTPHTAGETQAYEDNVIDILVENLARLHRGEKQLQNHVC